MDEKITPHFSKKILFLSLLFLLVSSAWYVLAVFSALEPEYRTVAPKIVFAETHDIQIKTVYDADFRPATTSQVLMAGTHIKTGELGFAEIVLENNIIRLDENTEIVLKENNFTEYSAYETDLPRLVFSLDHGTLWVNAFDRIEVRTARSSAQMAHSVGIITYSEPMNRVMVITGSADLAFYDTSGGLLNTYAVPLYNQVTYVDTQIVPEYEKLRPSKLKKELKLAPIAKSVLDDPWVSRNTMVDGKLVESKMDLINSQFAYSLKNNYYKIRSYLTFIPQTKRQLVLDQANTMLRYLLGGVHSGNKLYDAKQILAQLDALVSGMPGDPMLKELLTETFQIIGTPKSATPAYLVKEYLIGYLVSQDGPTVLRSFMSDLRNNLYSFELDEAQKTAEAWLAEWSGKEKSNTKEFANQSQMLHRIILSYSDRVTSELLAVFDKTGDSRMTLDDNSEEMRFVITEERLEISSALVASFRYLAAKQYLKTSYESLKIDELDTKLASREIFLEHAKLLAQRIEYAEEAMHGAAAAIDETEFREYIKQKTRDELLSENLKAFLQVDKGMDVSVEPPDISDVIQKFSDARISVIESDIAPKKDFPFAFDVKNARLLDRASDGSTITFDAVYDYSVNAVNEVFTKGISLKGNFELNDLVAILKKNHLGLPLEEVTTEDITYLLLSGEDVSDEAMRAQITAQNLARQLLVNELAEAGIKVGADQIKVLDLVTLDSFEITEGYIDNPADSKNPIKISFKYNSSSEKASDVYSDGTMAIAGSISINAVKDTVLGDIVAQKQQEDALKQFQDSIKDKSLVLINNQITVSDTGIIEFEDLQLTTLPLSVDGSYNMTQDKFVKVTNQLYSGKNVDIKTYFTELAYLFVIDYLKQNGISAERELIKMEYPFDLIQISGYESNNQTFDFTLDISANRLKNVKLVETGASVESMTINEFLNIAPQTGSAPATTAQEEISEEEETPAEIPAETAPEAEETEGPMGNPLEGVFEF